MALLPHALTNKDKVKLFLGIPTSDTSKDELLDDVINYVTDFIEAMCGRRFLQTEYADELYDAPNGSIVFIREWPIVSVTQVEYRSGVISNPTWNTFDPNFYIVDKKSGYIKFYTNYSKFGYPEQFLRLGYTAGYLIDFDNEVDPEQHTLPHDITLLANELCSLIYNRRTTAGITSETTEGQSVTYVNHSVLSDSELTETQRAIINKYQKHTLTI